MVLRGKPPTPCPTHHRRRHPRSNRRLDHPPLQLPPLATVSRPSPAISPIHPAFRRGLPGQISPSARQERRHNGVIGHPRIVEISYPSRMQHLSFPMQHPSFTHHFHKHNHASHHPVSPMPSASRCSHIDLLSLSNQPPSDTADDTALYTAHYIARRINTFQPTSDRPFVLGLPTGGTPLGTYRHLVRLFNEKVVSFRHVVTVSE